MSTPESRASVASQLLGWLPLRLRQRSRVFGCAGWLAAAALAGWGRQRLLLAGMRHPPPTAHPSLRTPTPPTRSSELTSIIGRSGRESPGGALGRKLAAAEEGAPLVGGRGYRSS